MPPVAWSEAVHSLPYDFCKLQILLPYHLRSNTHPFAWKKPIPQQCLWNWSFFGWEALYQGLIGLVVLVQAPEMLLREHTMNGLDNGSMSLLPSFPCLHGKSLVSCVLFSGKCPPHIKMANHSPFQEVFNTW